MSGFEDQETKLNRVVYEFLKDHGIDCIWERRHSQMRSVDIQAKVQNIDIALEFEKFKPSAFASAIKDASSRLVPMRLVEVSLAIVYPKGCINEKDVIGDTELKYVILQADDVKRYGRKYTKHSKEAKWKTCTLKELPAVVRAVPRDAGDPDGMAKNLHDRLVNAVESLNDTEQDDLCRSISLPTSTESCRRAFLILATASLFHARLDAYFTQNKFRNSDFKRPETLGKCIASDDISVLNKAWGAILKRDYRPIFQIARDVLAVGTTAKFRREVMSMADWGRAAAISVEGTRHDLLGRIFHRELDTAKQDGSYYTSTAAAVLLAGLAIRSKKDIPSKVSGMRIIDPACGTGTLLMAVTQRIKELVDVDDDRTLIERVLYGMDVNISALHMAATTLGLLSPSTEFRRMHIDGVPLGYDRNRHIRIGSLELYQPGGLLEIVDWYGSPLKRIDSDDPSSYQHHFADMVIMNPPYTRNDLRHDQFEEEELIKKREQGIFAGVAKGMFHSSGYLFLLLGERLLKNTAGKTMAVVFPLSFINASSMEKGRKFLSERFHVDSIVTSSDRTRPHFSENTTISECLLILRRKAGRPSAKTPDTRVIRLISNPGTVGDAAAMVRMINQGRTDASFEMTMRSSELISEGDWFGSKFDSKFLVKKFREMRDGRLFTSTTLGSVAKLGSASRGIRGCFEISDQPSDRDHHVVYYHKSGKITSMRAAPDQYIRPKPDMEKTASNAWKNAGCLSIAARVRTNLALVMAVRTDKKSVGTAWESASPRGGDAAEWSDAMAVYLNSTVGIVAMLGVRTPKTLHYPMFSIANIRSIPVPVFTDAQLKRASKLYRKYRDRSLGTMLNPGRARIAIDDGLCAILGVERDVVETMRAHLSRESMAVDRTNDTLDDFVEKGPRKRRGQTILK